MVKYTTKESLQKALSYERNNGARSAVIGFVPTMGALHKGHLSLVERAIEENDVVVVSIFVNPTQFNNSADLEKYPRNIDRDLSLLDTFKKDIMVFLPKTSDIYGEKTVSKNYDFGALENEMEGKHRKGHFDGVGTVLSKFFQIINPHRAYFGEKDFQQLQIVKKLVDIENLPVEIVGCPILREQNGLAMSSRNERLDSKQFEEAGMIYKTLLEVRRKFETTSIAELNKTVAERFLQKPEIKLEYFEIANETTLETETQKNESVKYRAFIAAYIGEIRLIDNMPLN